MLQPQQPNSTPAPSEPAPSMAPTASTEASSEVAPTEDGSPTPEEIDQHLDSLSPDDQKFLATMLTPETVRAIGLISGTAVGEHLMKFADQSKVLVPVPRQEAEKFIAEQQAKQQSPSAPQGAPQAPAQPAPSVQPAPVHPQQMPNSAAPQGLMAPR